MEKENAENPQQSKQANQGSIMPPKINVKATAQVNRLLHGWGFVEGRWVYVPLWDPPPNYRAFRQLIAAAALADGAKLVSSKAVAEKLNALAGSLVKKAADGFTRAWEDGDPICPPWPFPRFPRPWPPIPFPWPPLPGPGPDPGPDPWPIREFIQDLNPVARNAVIGNMVALIGETIGDRSIIDVGNEIMAAR